MKPIIRTLAEITGMPCPCGQARRIITAQDGAPASFHVVTIKVDSAIHYHRRQTEIYHVLEGKGVIWLDGQEYPLRKGTTVLIPPLVRHRARGRLTIVNVVIPAFDPSDEYIETAAGKACVKQQPCGVCAPPGKVSHRKKRSRS